MRHERKQRRYNMAIYSDEAITFTREGGYYVGEQISWRHEPVSEKLIIISSLCLLEK